MTDNSYHINYQMLLKDKNILSVTRNLALRLRDNPYLTVGDFLSSISDADLHMLLNNSDKLNSNMDLMCDIVLITMMLSAAEGLDADAGNERMTRNVNAFVTFLAVESLSRHGLVKAYRQNMTFGDDYENNIIVERIDE